MFDFTNEIKSLEDLANDLDRKIKEDGGAPKIALQYYSYAKSFASTMKDIQSGKNKVPEETVTQLRKSSEDLINMVSQLG